MKHKNGNSFFSWLGYTKPPIPTKTVLCSCGRPSLVPPDTEPLNWKCDQCVFEADMIRARSQLIKKDDPVNPAHYKSHPSGVEAINITEHYNFCLGNAIKYIWRAGLKSSTSKLEDLKKAQWYLNREIAREEKNANALPSVPPAAGETKRPT